MIITVPVPGGLEHLATQLDTGSGTEGYDCTAATICTGIRQLSHGRTGARDQDEVADWVRRVRRWSNKTRGTMLVEANCLRAWRSDEMRQVFTSHGLGAPIVKYNGAITWETVKKRLYDGWFVQLFVQYGVLGGGAAPMGSRDFSGNHSLALMGARNVDGKVYTNDGDPLFDGRRGEFPKGWQVVRLPDFRRAAGAFGKRPPGTGKAIAISVKLGGHR